MKVDWKAVAITGGGLALGVLGAFLLKLRGGEMAVFIALLTAIGAAAAAAMMYFNKPAESAADAPLPGDSELDVLVRDANRRLSHANAGATIAALPVVFVIGDRGTAKTSTIVNSGIEPELLAGHVYQENAVAPTRSANLWFARGSVLVEAGGSVLGEPANWMRLIRRLRPGKLKSLGSGVQSPRAVLLCVSLEHFIQPGSADALAGAARYLQSRLGEISQALGIRFPVYMLFTKTDRMPFFTDFVGTLSNPEANQVFGATVPMRSTQNTGVYAEEETRRLTAHFDKLLGSLAEKRTVFLPRESDPDKLPGAYEFPRELRKLRGAIVQLMVDVCRPSQLGASPFLRGFYFSGVRPVVQNDSSPAPVMQAPQREAVAASGATGMFRAGKQAEMRVQQSVAQPSTDGRKVPQWLFLGHLFTDVILRDSAAMSASGSSIKTSALRRALLAAAAVVCLIFGAIFLTSFLKNRALENEAIQAAKAIPTTDTGPNTIAGLDSLQKLDLLRQNLQKLTGYSINGRPTMLGWGLYQGGNMYPEVRRIYYNKFRQLLFGQIQTGLVDFLGRTPATPGPSDDYGYAYNTLKAYLLTGPEWKRTSDQSYQAFLSDLMFARWIAGRDQQIGKDRMDLARRQMDFYARDLPNGNPYPGIGDAAAIQHNRVYLSRFSGVQRVYQYLLAEAGRHGPSTTFNQKFPGTADVVVSTHAVGWAYTKDGADFMQKQIRDAKFGGETWVLGNETGQALDKTAMEKGIRDLYVADYINQWRNVLKTSRVTPYTSLKDASAKLNTITGSQAPILALFWWTSQNTAVSIPEVDAAFQSVHQVSPPSSVQQYVVAANQPYNNGLLKLQATIEQAAALPNGPDAGAEKATQDDAQAARQSAKQITASFAVDPVAHIESTVQDLMLKPIVYAEGLAHGMGTGDLNGKGAAFCAALAPMLRKFPFTPSAQPEASLDEISDIFKPKDGKLWIFYSTALKAVIQCGPSECTAIPSAPVQITPAFLHFFNQAAGFSKALYGDSAAAPNFKYSLRPEKSDQVEQFDVTVNGDTSHLAGGAQKSYTWPGSASPNFKLNLKLAGGTSLGVQSRDGLWSVFRFFADADKTVPAGTGSEFFWNFRQGQGGAAPIVSGRPLAYEFTLDAGGAPVVFGKEFLAGLRCVAAVAH